MREQAMNRSAFFETNSTDEHFLQSRLDASTTFMSPAPFEAGLLPQPNDCAVLSVFIHSRLDAASLAGLPNLKIIATRSTGYDHIDLDYCRSRGITVCNVPVYGDNTVAEHT